MRKYLLLIFILFSSAASAHHFADEADGGGYTPPTDRAYPYMDTVVATEDRLGLPHFILSELAWAESSFIPEIVSCKVSSSAGALGVMQIIPKFHPGVNPCNPKEAIMYAGAYLKVLHKEFGDWYLALAAYNWGWGNVAKVVEGDQKMPASVHKYATSILKGIGWYQL